MSDRVSPDAILNETRILADLLAGDHTPQEVWEAASDALNRLIGHQLFTVLIVDGASGDVVRAFSNQPEKYPVSGRKQMGPTPWGDLVLKQGKPFIGHNADDIRWAFPDHDLILSMGLESAFNLPVRYAGLTVATLNMLDEAGHFSTEDVRIAKYIAPLLIAPCLQVLGELQA